MTKDEELSDLPFFHDLAADEIRLSGPSIRDALVKGLTEAGCDVMDIGQCGTEMIYFTTAHFGLDGGIMITASPLFLSLKRPR